MLCKEWLVHIMEGLPIYCCIMKGWLIHFTGGWGGVGVGGWVGGQFMLFKGWLIHAVCGVADVI